MENSKQAGLGMTGRGRNALAGFLLSGSLGPANVLRVGKDGGAGAHYLTDPRTIHLGGPRTIPLGRPRTIHLGRSRTIHLAGLGRFT